MRLAIILPLTCLLAGSALRADAPANQPPSATLFNGRVEFTPPPDWEALKTAQTGPMAAIYSAPDHDGFLAIHVLPTDATITPAAGGKIIAQLRSNHKRAGQQVVQEGKIEEDARFALKIHERYKTAEGKIADETHIYREVGGRVLELDVQCVSDDADRIGTVRKAGEETLLSAKWNKVVKR